MRRTVGLVFVMLAAAVTGAAAQRDWQTGTWKAPAAAARPNAADRDYRIETETFQLDLRETTGRGGTPLAPAAGTPVSFAIDGTTVYIRQGEVERPLRLVKRTEKGKTYSAFGGGHYIKEVAGEGLRITLEDGSVWEIDPARQYSTAHWQPLAAVAVIHNADRSETAYDVVLNNTDDDEGAPAKLISVR